MRVAVVHSFYSSDSPSGENEVVLSQVQALQSAGVDTKLFARYTDSEIRRPGYPVRAAIQAAHLAGPGPGEELVRFNPDIIHVHNLFPNWAGGWLREWPGRVVSTLHNFRTICSNGLLWRDGHDCTECIDFSSGRALRHKCYRDSVVTTLPLAFASRNRGRFHPQLRHSAVVVALSERARALLAHSTRARVEVVPNFCERPSRRTRVQPATWLYVGRLTPEKGVMELISQIPSNAQLTVVGDGPLAGAVRAQQEVNPNLRFAGRLAHDQVIEEISRAKGLIIPSLWSEGIPTTAIEALSCGTPLIVSKRVAACEELTAGGAGLGYDPATKESLVRGLATVEAERDRFSAAAVKLYSETYSPEKWREKMLSVYRGLIEDRA